MTDETTTESTVPNLSGIGLDHLEDAPDIADDGEVAQELTVDPEPGEASPPPIFVALAAVMAEVGAVAKDSRNRKQGFNFRGVDAVVNTVGPVLRRHGVLTIPFVEDVAYEQVTAMSGTDMRQCTLRTRWRFVGPAGDHLEAVVMSEALDAGDKATAKAHSVSYRTVLLQVLCIPTDDPDPDAQTFERAAAPLGLTKGQERQVRTALAGADDNVRAQFRAEFGEYPSAIPSDRFAEATTWIRSRTRSS